MDLDLLLATPQYIVEKLKRDQARRWCPQLRGHVVDIGCGYSPYREFLTGASQYTGIEAEARYKPDIVAYAYNLPMPDDSVDSVMLTEVLEHLAEPEMALHEACRILKSNGQLYVTVPMTWALHYVPHDYYRFTRYGISHLLNKAGFEVQSIEPMGGLFAIISARLADFFSTIFIDRPLKNLGIKKGRLRMSAIPLAPYNISTFYLSALLDKLWRDDVFGWAVVARKNERTS